MFSKRILAVAAIMLLAVAGLGIGFYQLVGHQQALAGPVGVSSRDPEDVQGHLQRTEGGSPVIPVAPALPASAGSVAFLETFDKSQKSLPDGWRTLPDAPGSWATTQSHLEQWGDLDRMPSDSNTVLVTKDNTFSDGILEAQVFPMGREPVGLVFRGSDSGYYRLTLFAATPGASSRALLEKVGPDGKAIELAANKDWAGYALNRWQRMEVRATGGHIIVLVDGTQLIDVTDSAFGAGWVGVWTVADRGSAFDNVRVQRTAAGR